jgi:AraC-like DNA-binding protein
LWVEGQASAPESYRTDLEKNGIDLVTACDRSTAVWVASRHRCDAIILDQRIGEESAFDVLGRLRLAGISVPVIGLTAHPDPDWAFRAGRVGMVACLQKPLIGIKAVDVIRAAAQASVLAPVNPDTSPGGVLARWLGDLEGTCDDSALAGRLAAAAADPALTLVEFLAVSTSFRLLRLGGLWPLPLDAVRALAAAADLRRRYTPAVIWQVVMVVEAARDRWKALRCDILAAELQTDCGTLREALHDTLGVSFRTLIRTILVRRGSVELAAGDDHVRQVAFRLGYDRETSFNHDFRAHCGMSPKEFRGLLAKNGFV